MGKNYEASLKAEAAKVIKRSIEIPARFSRPSHWKTFFVHPDFNVLFSTRTSAAEHALSASA